MKRKYQLLQIEIIYFEDGAVDTLSASLTQDRGFDDDLRDDIYF